MTRGLRHPAAARRRRARQRQPDAVRADLLRARRHRSLHDRGLGRVPGPLRRGQLHRQGHLRRRRVRGGAGGPLPGERAAQPRPVRGRRTRAPALCTDIELFDDYPSHYLAFASRQHRWVRGDWQIARWLWRTVPDASGRTVRNALPVICALEDLRQPAPQPARAIAGDPARRRLDGAAWWPAALDGGGAAGARVSDPASQLARSIVQPRRRACRCARHLAGRAPEPSSLTAQQAFCGSSLQLHQSVVDARRDRPHAVAPARHPAAPARVVDRRPPGARRTSTWRPCCGRCGSRPLLADRASRSSIVTVAPSDCCRPRCRSSSCGSSRRRSSYVTGRPAAASPRSRC